MDKNFFIAILLTIAIIFVFSSKWYQNNFGRGLPPKTTVEAPENGISYTPQSTVQQQTAITGNEQTITAEKSESFPETSGLTQINKSVEKTVSIENYDIAVTFNTRGGAIVNATIKQFSGLSKDEPVQLVTPDQAWCTGEIVDNDTVLSFSNIIFEISDRSENHITFVAELSTNARIIREYSLEPEGFLLKTDTKLEGYWNNPEIFFTWNGPLNNTEAPVKQLRIWPFTMFMRDENKLYNKIAYLGQGDRTITDDNGKEKYKRIYSNESAQKHVVKKIRSQHVFDGDLDWYAVRNKYFMTAAIPLRKARWNTTSQSGLSNGQNWFDFTISKRISDGDTALNIFLGPISYNLLKSYNYNLTEIMELSWRFIRPLSIGFLWLIKKIHAVIPNWGLTIIIFSIIIKVVLYPLSKKSIDSMRKMSSLQPQITELKGKFKNNQQKQHTAMMELYKKEGINPMSGCLPMILQMPVFFALYPVIGKAFELRQAMFIPHWIIDLSRPDPLFILPVAMGLSMFFQTKSTMKDPNQKAMMYVMPVMMVILFANFSSGLTLYWFMFNIMTLLQQKMVKAH